MHSNCSSVSYTKLPESAPNKLSTSYSAMSFKEKHRLSNNIKTREFFWDLFNELAFLDSSGLIYRDFQAFQGSGSSQTL